MKNILVIEDDKTVRTGIIELLREEGFSVIGAENGRIGVEYARQIIPDLILSDILMPELDGYGVLEELQSDAVTASIPFIFLSARTGINDIRTGMNIGADDYLTKPYKAHDLLDAVNSRLNKVNIYEKKLEELNESIIRSLPHELRTPLVSILGFSQMLKEETGSLSISDIKNLAGTINTSAYNLLDIIQKFLALNEIESVSADKNKLSSIKSEIIQNTTLLITYHAQRIAEKHSRMKDMKLELEPAKIKISEYYLQIIIEEIIENAIKFSSEGSEIDITSRIEDNFYIIRIADKGIGMSAGQIKNIGTLKQFDRDKNFQSGVGIGLSLVKRLLDIHNGSISFLSAPGRFTEVKISLPVDKE